MASLADMWSTVDPGQTYDTSNTEVAPVAIASLGSQWDQMVYGSFRDHKEYIDKALQQISQEAGLPANFDWKPYLEQAAQQQIQQNGKVWDERYNNNAEPIYRAVAVAAQTNPQLAPIAQQIGPGTQAWQQGEALRQSRADSSKASDKQNTVRFLSVLASAAGAAFFGPAAGAGAEAGTAGAAAGAGESVSGAYGATAGELGAAGTSYGAAGAGTVGAGAAIGGSTAEAGGAGIASAGTGAGAAGAGAGGVTTTQAAAAAPLASSAYGAGGSGGESVSGSYPATSGELAGAASSYGGSTDYMKLAGQVLPSLISAYGSNEQRKSQEQLAAEYRAMGAPYRSRLADLYANPNAFLTSPEVTIPVQQGTDSLARALSVRGNPAGSGTALQEIQNYSANQLFGRLGQEKDRLAGFGGLSFYNQAAPGASQAAINSQGQVYGDLGYGVGNVMNPQQYNNNQSLAAILKAYNTSQGLT